MIYEKQIEVYRLEDGKPPEWVDRALHFKDIVFIRKDIIDDEDLTIHKNAIIGISDNVNIYNVDSYIIKDPVKGVYILSECDFKKLGCIRSDK